MQQARARTARAHYGTDEADAEKLVGDVAPGADPADKSQSRTRCAGLTGTSSKDSANDVYPRPVELGSKGSTRVCPTAHERVRVTNGWSDDVRHGAITVDGNRARDRQHPLRRTLT